MYHDAPISRICHEGDDVVIDVEAYSISAVEDVGPSRIRIRHSTEILRNEIPVERLDGETGEAEILSFETVDGSIELKLLRMDAAPRGQGFVLYRFVGADFSIETP